MLKERVRFQAGTREICGGNKRGTGAGFSQSNFRFLSSGIRPTRRWVDNIRMDLQKVGCGYVDWIELALDRDSWRTLVSAVMNLRVP